MTTRPRLPVGYRHTKTYLDSFGGANDWQSISGGSFSIVSTSRGNALSGLISSAFDVVSKPIDINYAGVAPRIGYWLYIDDVTGISNISVYFSEVLSHRSLGNYDLAWQQYASASSLYAERFQAKCTEDITCLAVKAAISSNCKLAIYSDEVGGLHPNALLGVTASTAMAEGWNYISTAAPVPIVAGTYYWLVLITDTANAIRRQSSLGTGNSVYKSATYANDFPETFPTNPTHTAATYAIAALNAAPLEHRVDLLPFTSNLTTGNIIQSGWNFVCLPPAAYLANGAGSWGNAQKYINMHITTISGYSPLVKISDIVTLDDSKPAISRIMFDFDNGLSSVHSVAYPILAAAGFRASTGVISGLVGTSMGHETGTYSLMSEAQLAELYAAGWDLNNHTKDHNRLNETYALNLDRIGTCQTWLEDRGFTRGSRHLVFPSGSFAATTFTAMADLGVLSGRTWVSSIFRYDGYAAYPINSLGTCPMSDAYATVAEIKAAIDTAISIGGSISMCGHAVVAEYGTDYDMLTANFQAIVDHVKSKGSAVEVVTRSEFYEGLIGNPRHRSLPLTRSQL
jgi:peptidoglycan/xylan/chitin deacetylase (PgdA/CDA1 family)